jgi:3-oxoacyl-[acyl-carrier protein] reductase
VDYADGQPDGSRVVVVTGGASGIGRATAVRFAESGDTVVVWDVKAADVPAPDVHDARDRIISRTVNVSIESEVRDAVDELLRERGRVDVLVNNAGVLRDHQLVRSKHGVVTGVMTSEDFDDVLAVNLRGVFLCTRAVAPSMIERRSGVILNAGSVVGFHGNFGQTNYAATKAAVHSMTGTWARELGRHGIRVNAVAPGFIRTAMATSLPSAVLEGVVGRTPLGRMGEAREVAEAYYWLASEAASFVHGVVLSVDGGLVLGT